MDALKRVGDVEEAEDAKKELHDLFNDQGYSDYMVVYLRLLTSGQLQKEEAFYSCFIEGGRTVSVLLPIVYVCTGLRSHILTKLILMF